jgi:molecular chaperone GrpE
MNESQQPDADTATVVSASEPQPPAMPEPAPDEAPVSPGEPRGEAQPEAAAASEIAPADDAPQADRLATVLERLEDRLEESQRLLARQSDITTSLHAENQRLKAGELRSALQPIVRDMIRVQDVLKQMLDAECGPDPDPAQQGQHPLFVAIESIVDALARNGVEVVAVAAGDRLDPRGHKVVGVAATENPDEHRTIAEVMKAGFAWEDGTTIRAADVRVYKHSPPPSPPDPSPEPASDADEPQS